MPNHIPVHDADWFKCHFWQLYFKADFTWLTHAKKRLAAKSDENIVQGEKERSIKAAEKDPSTTVVISIRLTGATVVGSVNATEFWQRRTWPPSFLLLLSCKMDLAVPQ